MKLQAEKKQFCNETWLEKVETEGWYEGGEEEVESQLYAYSVKYLWVMHAPPKTILFLIFSAFVDKPPPPPFFSVHVLVEETPDFSILAFGTDNLDFWYISSISIMFEPHLSSSKTSKQITSISDKIPSQAQLLQYSTYVYLTPRLQTRPRYYPILSNQLKTG